MNIFQAFREWRAARRARRFAEHYEAGRQWALAALARGESGKSIDDQIWAAFHYDSRSEYTRAFDRGAQSAIKELP